MAENHHQSPPSGKPVDRRGFISSAAMVGGLAAGYGTMGVYAVRYLYPAGPQRKEWLFVTELAAMRSGDSLDFEDPTGAKIAITRHKDDAGDETDFIALSSVCPHLGCKVHWQPNENRFFCPCHNGVFNEQGVGIDGPPVGQSLAHYKLDTDDNRVMLFIEVPIERLGSPEDA